MTDSSREAAQPPLFLGAATEPVLPALPTPDFIPETLRRAKTGRGPRIHPLLDALAPITRLQRLSWAVATTVDSLRWGWGRFVQLEKDLTQRAQLDLATDHSYSRGSQEHLPRKARLLKRRHLVAWRLLQGFRRLPAASTNPSKARLSFFRWFPFGGVVRSLAHSVHDAPPVCGSDDLVALRACASWSDARRWAARRWPSPEIARAALVWAARADQPVWAWRQLFHRADVTQRPPVVPFPHRPRAAESLQAYAHVGDVERAAHQTKGQQPDLLDIPSLENVRVPWGELRTWLASPSRLERRSVHRRGRWAAGDHPGRDEAQRSVHVFWHRMAFSRVELTALPLDRLMRWVQVAGPDLVSVAAHDGAAEEQSRDPHAVAGGRVIQDVSLLLSQVFSRSLLRLMMSLRDTAGPAALSPAMRADLSALACPAAADARIRQWAWWASEEPTGGRAPTLARLAGWTARLSRGSLRDAAWERLVSLSPVMALQVIRHREILLPTVGISPSMLRPLLLSPDKEVRHHAVATLGTLSTLSASGANNVAVGLGVGVEVEDGVVLVLAEPAGLRDALPHSGGATELRAERGGDKQRLTPGLTSGDHVSAVAAEANPDATVPLVGPDSPELGASKPAQARLRT